jgi:hypothetical protein
MTFSLFMPLYENCLTSTGLNWPFFYRAGGHYSTAQVQGLAYIPRSGQSFTIQISEKPESYFFRELFEMSGFSSVEYYRPGVTKQLQESEFLVNARFTFT